MILRLIALVPQDANQGRRLRKTAGAPEKPDRGNMVENACEKDTVDI